MIDLWTAAKELMTVFAPTGQETAMGELIQEKIAPYTDGITRDGLGGLTAHMRGVGKRVFISVPMDTPGFIVTHIDPKGFAWVAAPGVFSHRAVSGADVRLLSGERGILQCDTHDKLYIDLGVASKEALKDTLKVGDSAVFASPLQQVGDCVTGPDAARLLVLAVLLSVIPQFREQERAVSLAFTVQGQTEHRGAKPSAFGQTPHCAIALDVSRATDHQNGKNGVALRGGAALRYMDKTSVCPTPLRLALQEAAERDGIPLQPDLYASDGSDAGSVQLTGAGIPSAVVTVPARYRYTPRELCALQDAQAVGKLLVAFLGGSIP